MNHLLQAPQSTDRLKPCVRPACGTIECLCGKIGSPVALVAWPETWACSGFLEFFSSALCSHLHCLFGEVLACGFAGPHSGLLGKPLYSVLSFHLSAGVSKSQEVKHTVPRCGLLS